MSTSSKAFLSAIQSRRSHYALEKKSPISDAQIQDLITDAVLHVPSAFNSQTTRVVLLLKEHHDKLWDITKEVLKAIVPEDKWAPTEQRLGGFGGAYGTVLFFTDRRTIQQFQQNIPLYAERFPTWATQTDGMTQFAIWTALEAEGLGANLQHYNPLIDEKVAAQWGISEDWVLSAQLVFGGKKGEAGEKSFADVGERFRVFGA